MEQVQTATIQYTDFLETYTAHIQKKRRWVDRMDTGSARG